MYKFIVLKLKELFPKERKMMIEQKDCQSFFNNFQIINQIHWCPNEYLNRNPFDHIMDIHIIDIHIMDILINEPNNSKVQIYFIYFNKQINC